MSTQMLGQSLSKNAPTKFDALMRRFPGLKQFVANPVVIRDLRAQMRGSRSYWFIGGYLLLMGVLAVAGYAQATGQSLNPLAQDNRAIPFNIVDAQGRLEGFYYFIFVTLAMLITLIAPALTAASVVGERQRQSFDLLVTTPLTSGHILVGKLMSSIAFLGLLLVLSLPASALCILLGGATLADVFRVYFLLAVDGIVLSAIGLYFSCAVRVPLLATVWTYAAVLGYFAISGYAAIAGTNGALSAPVSLNLAISLAWLNPLVAIMPVMSGDGTTLTITLRLLAFVGLAGLLVRLLLTAATYRLGLFGAASGVSLRKQILLLTFLAAGILSDGAARYGANGIMGTGLLPDGSFVLFASILLLAASVALPFLPGLFVPATGEDAPPGAAADAADEPSRHRPLAWRRAFRTEHSGSLPYYILWLATVLLGIVAGAMFHPPVLERIGGILALSGFYGLCLGFLLWSLSRLAGGMVSQLSSARATAFALFIALVGLPTLVFTLSVTDWKENPFVSLWILSPVMYSNPDALMDAMARSGVVAAAFGALAFITDRSVRRRKG